MPPLPSTTTGVQVIPIDPDAAGTNTDLKMINVS